MGSAGGHGRPAPHSDGPDRIQKGDAALTHPSQGIAAMVMIEPRRQKRQQDFVDLGQTAPIQRPSRSTWTTASP